MPAIREIDFAALDFESAGLRAGGTDFPVQIGIALASRGRISGGLNSFIACDAPVTWRAREVHGIGPAQLEGAPSLTELWHRIKGLLGGRWVVAHGAATEKRFLRAFPFHGFGPWVDTLKLARAVDPGLPSHALGDLARHYGLEEGLRVSVPGFRWHDAYSDAVASLEILHHLIDRMGWKDRPAGDLLLADDSAYHRSKSQHRSR